MTGLALSAKFWTVRIEKAQQHTHYGHNTNTTMKKALLITAAALAASVISSEAQVYSQNVVGYVNQPILGSGAGKYNLISNPLNGTDNSISNLVQNPTDGTIVYFWKGGGFGLTQFAFGSWDSNATNTIAPGAGVFVATTGNFTNTFTGTVLTSSTNVFSSGYSIVSSQFPVNGNADSLGLTSVLADGDLVYKWNFATQGYVLYQWAFGAWSGPGNSTNPPTINIGEAVFIYGNNGGSWANTNSIN